MNQQTLYFAYGSNLNRQQIKSRCPGSKYIKNYYLPGYKLSFSWKPTRRQSTGVANIVKKAGSKVPGTIYKINSKDREQLRTGNRNYLVIKQTSTHENIHPTLLLPGNDARKRS